MDVTPLIRKDAKIIQSYKAGEFKVSGQVYKTDIIVLPTEVIEWSLPDGGISALTVDDFKILRPYLDHLDVLLFGTGQRIVMPPATLRIALKQEMNIVLEMMDNGAAARTYNVLMAEGRNVGVVLIS